MVGIGGFLTFEQFQIANEQRLQEKQNLERLDQIASATPILRTVPQDTLKKIAQSNFNDQEQEIIALGLGQGKTQEEIQRAIGKYRAERPTVHAGFRPTDPLIRANPWTYMLYTVLALFSVPIGTFGAGYALLWAASGFRS